MLTSYNLRRLTFSRNRTKKTDHPSGRRTYRAGYGYRSAIINRHILETMASLTAEFPQSGDKSMD